MKKRGSIHDIAYAMIIIFVVGIVFLTVKYSYTTTVNIMTNNTIVNSSEAAVTSLRETRDLTNRFDYVLFVLLMGFTLAIFIVGWFSGGHPLFAFIYFIALVILVAVSAILSFVWERFSAQSIFTTTINQLPIIDLILDNFPIYIAIVGFVGMLIMFAKPALSPQ